MNKETIRTFSVIPSKDSTTYTVIIEKEVIEAYISGTGKLPVYKEVKEVYTFENLLDKTVTEKIF